MLCVKVRYLQETLAKQKCWTRVKPIYRFLEVDFERCVAA